MLLGVLETEKANGAIFHLILYQIEAFQRKENPVFVSFLGAVLKGNLARRSKCWTYNRQTIFDRNL